MKRSGVDRVSFEEGLWPAIHPPAAAYFSPLGFIGNNAPGFWGLTNIEKYGLISNEGPAPGGFVGINFAYRSGITCQAAGYTNITDTECISNGWQMHVDGQNAINQSFGGVLADPANSSYQARWIEASITYINAHSNDGFWIDDTTPRVYDFYNGTFGDVFPDEHPSMDAYKLALVSFADAVSAGCNTNGLPLPAYNSAVSLDNDGSLTAAWWQQMGPHVGYLTAEYWNEANAQTRKVGPEWYNSWDGWRAIHSVCLNAGCGFAPITYGDSVGGDSNAQAYTLGTFMLDWPGTKGSLLWANPNSSTTSDQWSTFYAQAYALGLPSSAAVNIGSNVWQRQFAHGTLSVDAVNGTATIT